MKKSKSVKSIVSVVLNISLILSLGTAGVQAAVKTESIPGNVYTFVEKNPYDIEKVDHGILGGMHLFNQKIRYCIKEKKAQSQNLWDLGFRT